MKERNMVEYLENETRQRSLKEYFAPPIFEDDDKTRKANWLNIILLAIFALTTSLASMVFVLGIFGTPVYPASIITGVLNSLLCVVLWMRLRRGHVRQTSIFLSLLLVVVATVAGYFSGSIIDPILGVYILAIIIAGILISPRASFVFTWISCLAILGLLYAETKGMLPPPAIESGALITWVVYAVIFNTISILIGLTIRNLNDALVQFQNVNRELHQSKDNLEQQVAARKQAMESSLADSALLSEISQKLASAPYDVSETARIIASNFVDLAYAPECSISLLQPDNDTLKVVADYFRDDKIGETTWDVYVGEETLLSDFPATARVMRTQQPLQMTVNDPNIDPAELEYMQAFNSATLLILPMVVGGRAIGVLEFEHENEEIHFTQAELNLAMAIATQSALALQNAQVFSDAQRRAESEALLTSLSQRIQSAASVEDVLQVAVTELSRTLGSKRSKIEIKSSVLAGDEA
jgi:hypothetical protein